MDDPNDVGTNGEGLSEEQVERLFEDIKRVGAKMEGMKEAGMGLDLYQEAYLDDVLWLQQIEREYPARWERAPGALQGLSADLFEAFMCRMFVRVMHSEIEHFIEKWKALDPWVDLKRYCEGRAENKEKVEILCKALDIRGATLADRQVVEDYIALKMLRNVVEHARLKEHEEQWIADHGFPRDPRELTREHFERMGIIWHRMTSAIRGALLSGGMRLPKRE